MSGFDDITIGWKGEEKRIPPRKCMELLARIEEILAPSGSGTSVLEVLGNPHKAHLTKLARAYAVALRTAGFEVTDQEVFLSLARGVSQGGVNGYEAILTLAAGLTAMFFPDWVKDEPVAQDDAGKAAGDQGATPSNVASSDTSMNLQSAQAG